LRNRGSIERGLGQSLVKEKILPLLDDSMGQTFEDMAREFTLGLVRDGELRADDVGFWQSSDGQNEIDIVGAIDRRPTFIGTVKWQRRPLDRHVLAKLEGDARALGAGSEMPWILVGRDGVEPRVLARPGTLGYAVEDLYRRASE